MKDKGGKRSLSTTSGDDKTVNSKRHAPNLSSERGGVGSDEVTIDTPSLPYSSMFEKYI